MTFMTPIQPVNAQAGRLARMLEKQCSAQSAGGAPDAATRSGRIDRIIALLVDNADAFAAALSADFGHRSRDVSLFADIGATIGTLKYAKANLARWMRPERRRVTPAILGLLGARASVEYAPKGVVGVISPWNFPVNLALAPLGAIFAAGNRAMIKPSEFTPETSALMARLVASSFDETEAVVVTGDADTGAAFAALPFDHLLFTGATGVGRKVAMAAARNLVPVTLELGGKSPVILGDSADLALAARRIMAGKTLNAGQICLAPDYALVPRAKLEAFVDAARAAVAQMYPSLRDNPDYGAVINRRHHERLAGYLDDARAKGAQIVALHPAGEDFTQQPHDKLPPTLVLNPSNDMALMHEEIFGPILPVVVHDGIADAIAQVNRHPRPLGLYYFGKDAAEEKQILSQTLSGGVTINDVLMHYAMEDLPFGGIGPSGMGAYHGVEGFRTFSHARAVYRQTGIDVAKALRPPYGAAIRRLVAGAIRK
jgi:coniferyl-aldehyde dehydrogenase